jgi:hypothetical protein
MQSKWADNLQALHGFPDHYYGEPSCIGRKAIDVDRAAQSKLYRGDEWGRGASVADGVSVRNVQGCVHCTVSRQFRADYYYAWSLLKGGRVRAAVGTAEAYPRREFQHLRRPDATHIAGKVPLQSMAASLGHWRPAMDDQGGTSRVALGSKQMNLPHRVDY